MRSKYLNLSIFGRQIINRLIIIIVILILSMLLGKKSKAQMTRLESIEEQRKLVQQMPRLKKQLRVLEKIDGAIEDLESKNINFALRGVVIKNKVPTALINDQYYGEGDSISNFIITKIYINKAELPYIIVKDKNTNQSEIIYLYLTP